MTKCLHKRLMSERGASLSFALFVFLVCCAVSSIVIAAATASAGQIAELGKRDQRYHSVTSAAGLFQKEFATGGSVAYVFTETTVKTYDERTGVTESEVLRIDLPSTASSPHVLYDITKYALYGKTRIVSGNDTNTSNAAKPFDNNDWNNDTGSTPGFKSIECSIEPTINGSSLSPDDLKVKSVVRFHDDWNLEVVLTNDVSNPSDQYNVYLYFTGHMSVEDEAPTITLADTDVSADAPSNIVTETTVRKYTVTWSLGQAIPGRGFLND